VRYDEARGQVYIDKDQILRSTPKEVWRFQVRDYQVPDKRLEDREGRALSFEDSGTTSG